MDHLEVQSRRATRRQPAHRPEDGSGGGGGRMTEPTGQLYVVHEGQIVALQGRTVESVMADFVALRIAHLRRMIEASVHVEERILRRIRRDRGGLGYADRQRAAIGKMDRFRDACRVEIARLRGEG